MSEMFKNRRKWLFAGAGLLAVLVAAGVIVYNVVKADKAESYVASSPGPDYEQQREQSIVAWGEVKYEKVYEINISFPSTVTGVNVKEGDRVSLGQELVRLDMSEYRGIVDKLREQLEAGQAGMKSAEQDTEALTADIAQLQKDIKTKTEELNKGTASDLEILQTSLVLAKKDLENAKRDVQDNQALYDAGSVPKNTLDQYVDILDKSEKALSDIESNIKKARSSLRTELDQLNIALKSKQAQLDQIKNSNTANTAQQSSGVEASRIDLKIMESKGAADYLSGDNIVSCVNNGIVQNIAVINGTALGTQNMPTRVLQLIDADTLVVSAEVDEEFINNITTGEAVNIVPATDSSLSIPGTVTHISNLAVEKDGKRIIKVEIKPQDPDGKLRPGYSADVYFPAK